MKPLDVQMLRDAADHPFVVTVEDGIRVGGAGAAITDAIAALDERRLAPPVLVLGTPVEFIPQGKPADVLAGLGLDGPGIAASVARAVGAPAVAVARTADA